MTDAIARLLDENALADAARPQLTSFPGPRESAEEDPACSRGRRAALANANVSAVVPLDGAGGFVVVKTLTVAPQSAAAPVTCGIRDLEAAKLRDLIDRLKTKQPNDPND